MDRRTFLATAAGALLGPSAGRAQAPPRRRMLQLNGYALDAETPLELLTDYLTPNDLFFVRHHWVPTIVDPSTYRLDIDGEVDQPQRLSLDDLRRLPQTSVTCVLQCAGNGRALYEPPIAGVQWRFGAVGNTVWTGVRVEVLLNRAGLTPAAAHLHAFGADRPPLKVPPFHRSVELDKALPDAIVAYEMNGRPLPHHHGAPARLVVPGWAGDHWMKWLTKLTAARSPQTGFYMDTAYRYPKQPGLPGAPVRVEDTTHVTALFVKSSITTAPRQARVGAPVIIRGFAFSGAPDIARVEVTDDDGASWTNAVLDPRHDPYAWRLWSWGWTPRRPGQVRIMARATDSAGAVQPREAVWNPSGYLHNGWHGVSIEVVS
jgi:DMSO/TMAO reductase YedYZ molybdopterin-dependent catalytic subunit